MAEADSADRVSGSASPFWYDRGPFVAVTAIIRGIGQVDFQPSPVTGLLILVALFSGGWQYGAFGILGSVVGAATASVLAVDRARILLGFEGFSACLTAIACYAVLGDHASTWIIAILGAITCPIINAALTTILGDWNLPTGTAPFCLVSGVIIVGAPSFERIWHTGSPRPLAELPSVTTGPTGLSGMDFFHAFFTNIAQVFLIDKWWVGLIMLVGLAFGGWVVFVTTVFSSLFAILFSWAMGAPSEMIGKGLYGYNAVLVGLALAATFLVLDFKSAIYAVIGVGASVIVTATLTNYFRTFGGHTFTWPFNLTMWLFLAATPAFAGIRRKTG